MFEVGDHVKIVGSDTEILDHSTPVGTEGIVSYVASRGLYPYTLSALDRISILGMFTESELALI